MNDVYRKLAKKLDTFPNGYPATESGVELRILKHIFSPEDAAAALMLKLVPESVSAIARRLGTTVEEAGTRLKEMADRGQIFSVKVRGRQRYMLAPFVVGIYEFQVERMDAKLAELFEDYSPIFLKTLGGAEPPLARVIPVNRKINAQAEILAHDDLRSMMEKARSFRVADCICRLEKGALDAPCNHTLETCLSFSRQENAYEDAPFGRVISREEAMTLLDESEKEGLVHCTYNVENQNMFVCNCCSCCCGFLRGVKEFEAPHLLVHSNSVAVIDEDACIVCGVCANERCPMEAISEGDDSYQVKQGICIGCGVCILECPADAITMVPRPEDEWNKPAKNLLDWSVKRRKNQIGPIRAMAQFGSLSVSAMRARKDTRE